MGTIITVDKKIKEKETIFHLSVKKVDGSTSTATLRQLPVGNPILHRNPDEHYLMKVLATAILIAEQKEPQFINEDLF